MRGCKEVTPSDAKWAMITLHPSLPSRSEQIARARAWGVAERLISNEDVSQLIVDDLRKVKRTTKWDGKFPERDEFIRNMSASVREYGPAEGTVFFATPLCVGFGPAHAMQTLEALWGLGFSVYVHSVGAIYRRGDDMTEFLKKVLSEANTAYVKLHRQRKNKPSPKRKPKS